MMVPDLLTLTLKKSENPMASISSLAVSVGLSSVFWYGVYIVGQQLGIVNAIPAVDGIVNQVLGAF